MIDHRVNEPLKADTLKRPERPSMKERQPPSLMKRYYSHYTFIYPDIYLKNHVVEMDDNERIIRFSLYERSGENGVLLGTSDVLAR